MKAAAAATVMLLAAMLLAAMLLTAAIASAAAQSGAQTGAKTGAKTGAQTGTQTGTQTAAQNGAGGSSPRARSVHSALQPHAPPLVLPEQFAPPQEAYASFPESAGAAAAPAAPSACQLRLAKVATFQALGTLIGPGDCGAPDAVQLQIVLLPDQTKVAVTPPATLRCPMAEQMANWLREDVAPALAGSGPPLRILDNFDSYECRGRNRVRAAALSEHGRADALDVRAFRLADGREIGLTDINVGKDLREKIRASACARFSTVLGPGSDGYHEEHVHLDLAERRNGYKLCEWELREPPPVEAKSTPADEASEQGEPAAAIEASEVPLPRPRPLAANLTSNRTKRSDSK